MSKIKECIYDSSLKLINEIVESKEDVRQIAVEVAHYLRIDRNDKAVNLDINDIRTILSGKELLTAVLADGVSVDGNLKEAIDEAVAIAGKYDFNIMQAKKLLIAIYSNTGLTLEQMLVLDSFTAKFKGEFEYKCDVIS